MKISALKEAVIAAIDADTAAQTLMGADAVDNRVYWFFNATAANAIDATHPAYIVYQLLATPETVGATGGTYLRFTVWGRDEQVVEDIRDRLLALFERQQLTLSDATVVYGRVVQETDVFDDTANFAGRVVEVRFGYLVIAVP